MAEGKKLVKQDEDTALEARFSEEEMTAKIAELESGAEYVVGGGTDIQDEVVGAICATAAREVDGVADVGLSSVTRTLKEVLGGADKRARGVGVEQGKREAILDLTVQVIYGFSIPQVVIEVRRRVGARLLEMTGLIAKEVNINITGIEFPEKMPGRVD
jgi:uncharacterized alkaline shock family protein YloU